MARSGAYVIILLLVLALPLASAKPKEAPPGWLRHGLFGAGEPEAPPAPDAPLVVVPIVILSSQEAPPDGGVAAPAPLVLRTSAPPLAPRVGGPFAGTPDEFAPLDVATAAFAPTPDVAPDGTPSWTWVLPVVGLVSVGAALATARPKPVVTPPPGLPRFRLATADVPSILVAGRDALAEGHVDEAVVWFTHATALQPRLAVAHFSRGVCLVSLGELNEAYRALKRAHDLDPREGAYKLEFARISARTGRHQDAMLALRPILDAMPELANDAAEDEAFAGLRDHPRFLAMTGRL